MAFFKLLLKLFKRKQSKDTKKKKNSNKPPKQHHQQQFVAVQQPVPIQQSIQGGKVTYVQPLQQQQQQQYVQAPVQQQQQYVQVPVQQQQQPFNPQVAANKVMAQQMAGYANGMTGNRIPQKYVNQGAAYAVGYVGGKQKAPAQAQASGYYAVAA
ncbi:hypothetical protein QBC36DRAFT_339828 [Triangularia setosa]|uniref:Uncharacterized protein n=1 Tax=Triangularia setosa TaxID=2587417 RepID=A0AAN6VXF1_9PEZI|nr:hypothetical protein QBC36DRAFT_339828 [Podospora setosa]